MPACLAGSSLMFMPPRITDRMRSISTSKKANPQKTNPRRMPLQQSFEQSIQINASATAVERCITDLNLMHRWLNPALRCESVGEWSTDVGSRSRFVIQIPFLQPSLNSVVAAREPGLVVWEFDGFFHGRDRWECNPNDRGTYLLNRFEFEIPNSLIRFGFNTFAASWTQEDMQAQLRRLKRVAEELHRKLHT